MINVEREREREMATFCVYLREKIYIYVPSLLYIHTLSVHPVAKEIVYPGYCRGVALTTLEGILVQRLPPNDTVVLGKELGHAVQKVHRPGGP